MKIKLSEIPSAGREYEYDRKSGELNEVLKDLIAGADYSVRFRISPMGNEFLLTGELKTVTSEICSRCGWDLEIPLYQKLNEVLVELPEAQRDDQTVHGNQSVDFLAEGPSMTPYRKDIFNAGEFIHESIALAVPPYPDCGKELCPNLNEVLKKQEELENEFQKKSTRVSPFEGLKNFDGLKKDS